MKLAVIAVLSASLLLQVALLAHRSVARPGVTTPRAGGAPPAGIGSTHSGSSTPGSSPAPGARPPDARRIVSEFIQQAQARDEWIAGLPSAVDIAKRLKAGRSTLREEVERIASKPTSFTREELATAIINAVLSLGPGADFGVPLPEGPQLLSLLATVCPEERGVWALAAGFSSDPAVRSRVVQIASSDSSEFARAAALRSCAFRMADAPDAQDAVLRASREAGQRYRVVAVLGLETIRSDAAVGALLDAAGSEEDLIRSSAETALARRAAWDDAAALAIGSLARQHISVKSAKRIWSALSAAHAIGRLAPADRDALEALSKQE
ncbi:MAG: hypothetical protein IT452_13465 [Planctomycetia bacterium]|nr:hypothetical protein [Planctomycetia bacterium]